MNRAQGVVAAQLACPETGCGQPRNTPGRPRRGWLQVHLVADHKPPAPWFCSWHCLSRYALKAELAGGPAVAP